MDLRSRVKKVILQALEDYPLTAKELSFLGGVTVAYIIETLDILIADNRVFLYFIDADKEAYPPVFALVKTPQDSRLEAWNRLLLIAKRNHLELTDCSPESVVTGMNFVECRQCGKHAHIGRLEDNYPLVQHGAGREYKAIRPMDF